MSQTQPQPQQQKQEPVFLGYTEDGMAIYQLPFRL